MVNQDSFTPQEYAKMVGMFPDPPQNPLPTGGYMDAGFDWVVHQAEGDDDDNYEKLLKQIEEKEEEIRYHEKMLDVAGYGRTELMELEALKQELADLESLAFGAEGEQEFTFSYTAYDVNTGEVIEESEVSVTASNEREARGEAMRMLEEGGLDDEEFVLQAEAVPISEEEELLVVRNDMGQTKGFIEMEEDLEEDSIEIEISDDEMEEIAEITLDAETATYEPSQEPDMEAPATEPTNANFEAQIGYDGAKGYARAIDSKFEGANKEGFFPADEEDFKDMLIEEIEEHIDLEDWNQEYRSDFVKPSRDWLSLALGTAAVVIGGSLFLQNRGVFKADGDGNEDSSSLVAHPSTGDLLPADYEEMVVESTGYAVPVIPVSLDPSFMGSRFHALPTDRVVESNEPGIGAHTDVAMTRDTNYREPEQTMVTEPPFAYKFNAEKKLSLLDRIKAFFMGHKDVKEANSITGQTPYFGVGFEPKNPQTRVIKETRPISLDPSTAPYLPTNLSGYTGQSYTPPSVYSDMMQIGITGQTPSFVSSQSSIGTNRAGSRPVATSDSLQSVHGNLSAGVNQSYTDGSKTMSLSQWSIEYDVSQISDSEAFAVSRSSGERTMIRRV